MTLTVAARSEFPKGLDASFIKNFDVLAKESKDFCFHEHEANKEVLVKSFREAFKKKEEQLNGSYIQD